MEMYSKEKYGKILVPVVTPFRENQSVDIEAMISIGERLIEKNFADTFILTGTTGEFFTMTSEERLSVFKAFKDNFEGRRPIIPGTGCASTVETIKLTQAAKDMGFDLVMIVAPYYTKPTQSDLYNHFKTVAETVDIDIMMYNIPIFTGVNLNPETVAELAKIPNIVGIKEEAELNAKQMTEFLNVTPDEFIVYNGDDTMVLESFVQGYERIGGVVSGAAHIIGDKIREMIDLLHAGKVMEASKLQRSLLPLYRSMGPGERTNPVCLLKDAMNLLGYNAGLPRLPLQKGTEEELEGVKAVMKDLDIL